MKKIYLLLVIIFISQNLFSQTWIRRLDGRSVWSLAKDKQGNIYAGGLTSTNSRIWKSTDQGNNWDTIYIGAGQTMWDFSFDTLGAVYVANFSAGLLKSTNNGANFTLIPSSVFSNKNLQGVKCGSGGYVFITTSTGFFRSTDYGATFTESASMTGLNCLPVLVDKDSLNIVYVGVSSAGGTGIGFYRSTDNGATFSSNLNPGKNSYNFIQRSNGEILQITTTSPYNLDRSTNKGLTWTSNSNTAASQRGIAVDPLGRIWTAGNGGVFRSTDNGLTFSNYNLTFSCTPMLSYSNKILTGVSGTASGGVYVYTDTLLTSLNNNSEPIQFDLNQNIPNPFNPSTIINYSLSSRSSVKLTVYDLNGKEVSVLINKKQEAGIYNIEFNGNGLSSGIYFYTLNVNGRELTRKMSLIK